MMTRRKRQCNIWLAVLAVLVLSGCSAASETASPQPGHKAVSGDVSETAMIQAVATTGQVADLVRTVGGERVQVQALMGPGVDPHLYKATQSDIQKLETADVIFYNGLNLEGKLSDIFVRMAASKPTVAVTETIPPEKLREPEEFDGHYDPHVWFDISLWAYAVERVRDALIELDPSHEATYAQNAAAYLKQLQELDAYAKAQIAQIPGRSRVLVTAHDAFGYFGQAYGMEVIGLQGISTDAEYGVKDVQDLVNLLVERRIKAVFIESSVSPKAIEAVVEGAKEKGHAVAIGGQLYSDAMGEAGTPEATYIGMFRHNVDTIVSALK
jgi:manganese/zinc/iron transport system substrate-binding protein